MNFTRNNSFLKKSLFCFFVVVFSFHLLGGVGDDVSIAQAETPVWEGAQVGEAKKIPLVLKPTATGNGANLGEIDLTDPRILTTPTAGNGPLLKNANTGTEQPKPPKKEAETNTEQGFLKDAGQFLGYEILSTAALVTWMGGNLLEWSVEKLVFGMGDLLNTEGFGGAIDITWKTIRDICNLVFIFGFIYTGIRTIIDPESAETKRFVAQIIIAALLINFSLFFTKFVIDFSNFSAVQIYQTILGDTADHDISSKFANLMGLSGLYDTPESNNLKNITVFGGLWFFIMGAIMLLVAGFVLASGAILLVVRFVALIFIMIFSPFLFAASVFPQTEEYSSKLWHHLISYAFFAPIFLLLLLISLTVLDHATKALGIGGTIQNALFNVTDSFGVILNFVIVIMFLIFSLKTASHLGVEGGEMAVHMVSHTGDHIRQSVQGAIGRNTVGWASRKALHAYEHFDAATANSKKWQVAKFAGKALTLGAVDDMSITHALHAGENAKFGSHYSNEDVHKHKKQHKARNEKLLKSMNILHLAEALPHDRNEYINLPTKGVPKDLYDAVRRASQGELIEALKDLDPRGHEFNMIVRALKNSQFEDLKKVTHDDFGEELKVAMRTARDNYFDPLEEMVPDKLTTEERNKLIKREIGMRKAEDVALFDKDILVNASLLDAAHKTKMKTSDDIHLRLDVLEKILSPGKLDRAAQQTIHANLNSNFANLPDDVQGYLRTSGVERNYGKTSGSTVTPETGTAEPNNHRSKPK